jgi:DNA-binding transcriptional LysR family regulator
MEVIYLQLQQLRYLIEVAETGSMNKAAQNLFISQPNLSNSIMSLEEEFNIKIFDRTNRGVEITKEGKNFLAHAKFIINQVNNVENIYNNLSKEKAFVLQVSSAKIFNLANILVEIYNNIDYKNIKISLKETHKENVIKDVANMDSEIGMLILSNIQERLWRNILEVNKLEFNEIAKDKVYIYVGENNPLYNKDVIYAHELKDFICVNLVEDQVSSSIYSIELDSLNILNKDRSIYLNDKETIAHFILKTDAYSLGSGWSSVDKREGIKAIPFADDSIDFSIGWIKRKREELSNEARMFLEIVSDNIKKQKTVI